MIFFHMGINNKSKRERKKIEKKKKKVINFKREKNCINFKFLTMYRSSLFMLIYLLFFQLHKIMSGRLGNVEGFQISKTGSVGFTRV